MPLYFFNLCSGTQKTLDLEGQELPDLGAAREEAIAGARDIAADCVRFGEPLDFGDRIEITDTDGKPLLTVSLRDAVAVKASAWPSPRP